MTDPGDSGPPLRAATSRRTPRLRCHAGRRARCPADWRPRASPRRLGSRYTCRSFKKRSPRQDGRPACVIGRHGLRRSIAPYYLIFLDKTRRNFDRERFSRRPRQDLNGIQNEKTCLFVRVTTLLHSTERMGQRSLKPVEIHRGICHGRTDRSISTFKHEEPAFDLNPKGESRERSVGADHTMARYDDANWIGCVSAPYRSG